MLFAVLHLITAFLPAPAFAGGFEGQVAGPRPCQLQGSYNKQGSCDEKKNPPIAGVIQASLNPAIAECLAEGNSMDVCLRRVNSNRFGSVIQCGEGEEAFRVKLAQPFSQMPREGEVPAEFENLPLVVGKTVSTKILPIFHMRLIAFQTAYCGFRIQVDFVSEAKYYVFGSSVECEGEKREISCRVL